MSFRKEILMGVGGFDERYGGTAEFEDMDMCLRVRKLGYRLIFDPSASVEHLGLPSGGCRAGTKYESFYWTYHNHELLFLKHFNKLFYGVLLSEYLMKIIVRAIKWQNPKIIIAGIKGIIAGLKDYLKPYETPN